ncbi:MAG: T9SS type A sorting domain-containing protein [Bacteroidetes bacterium]|nr:T9SS type A sorting domain-containing protein [Bacteroidota bacterium]
MKKFSTLLLICFSLASFAQYPIGHKSINFKDASRTGGFAIGGGTINPVGGTGRDIGTEIYYPATSAGNNTPVAAGNFPVIVFGHGFSMTWDAYTTLWDSLVNSGYIICFPRTESGIIPAPSHLDFGKDLAKVADLILAGTSPFAGSTTGRLAIGGHSMGGGSTFLTDQYTTSPTCYFTFAAAETNPKASIAAKAITKPHLVFSGTLDCVAPNAANQQLMYDSLASACKVHINLIKGYHCAFADNNFNCGFGEGTCITAGGLSSTEQQRRVRLYLNPYLDYYLKGVCEAWTKFQNLIDTATISTVQQICTNTVPANASISGNTFFCNSNSTTLTANPTGFQYLWSNNSTANTVSVNAAGNYSVVVGNGVCSLASVSVSVTQNFSPATPSAITSADTVCSNISNLSISVTNDAGATYNWNLPNGWNITAGSNTNSITATSGANGGTISVTAQNSCGTSSPTTATITVVPSNLGTPGTISGAVDLCAGTSGSFSITPVSGASTYSWSAPNGWSVVTLNPSTSIDYTVGNSSGIVSVSAVNNCGQSVPSTINVTVQTIPTLGILYGIDTVCLNSYDALNFSLSSADNADSIVWSASNPWNIIAGQGSSVLSVNSYMTSGAVSVYASNECGSTSTLSFNVIYVDTPQITITQQGSVLSANSAGAATYQWYDSGALISGANSADYTPVASGNYTVSITNQYGCSTQSAAFSFIYNALNKIANENGFRIFPNPNSTKRLQFLVEKDWLGGEIKIIDATGRLVAKQQTTTLKFEIELPLISSGIYIVSLEKGTQVLRKKLIVE